VINAGGFFDEEDYDEEIELQEDSKPETKPQANTNGGIIKGAPQIDEMPEGPIAHEVAHDHEDEEMYEFEDVENNGESKANPIEEEKEKQHDSGGSDDK
jgi:hypothetical protein